MSKLFDNNVNEILAKHGVNTTVPNLVDGGYKPHVHLDAGIYEAKEELKGVEYPSKLNAVTRNIQQFMQKNVDDHLERLSEWDYNISTECEALIEFCQNNGYISEQEVNETHGFAQASDELIKKQQGLPWEPSAAALVMEYSHQMYEASKPITEWVEEAKFRLSAADYKFDFTKKSEKWILAKSQKAGMFSDEERHLIAQALFNKDAMISKYTAQADTFALGDSQYQNALMFAFLYTKNLQKQRQREQKHDVEKDGPFKYSGFDSITSLFPLGAKELLAWDKLGEFVVFKKEGVRTAAYFELTREVAPQEAALLKQLTGRIITFDNGTLEGTNYRISPEERMEDGKAVAPNRQKMIEDGFMEEYVDELLDKPFKRGAKAWFGEHQQGEVVYVEVFKKSFKLWMVDFKNIG